ncbi:MAG TPA: hypothetical protein VM096_01405 [Vicinamibacterales bacterium]|nr:hypothetical protein [Vicinamibacterales bacterium]
MTHLTPDELIDAMEGLLSEDRQSHLAACEHCGRELAGLSNVMSDAKQVSVPEPSPLFWPNFSRRVSGAIDQESTSEGNWPAWMRWQVLLPLGLVAMIILALMIAVPKEDNNDVAPSVAVAPEAPEAPEGPQDRWVMLADLVGDIDVDTASAAGVALTPGDAEQAVLHLNAEEQQELTRLLKVELTRAKS